MVLTYTDRRQLYVDVDCCIVYAFINSSLVSLLFRAFYIFIFLKTDFLFHVFGENVTANIVHRNSTL